MSLDETDTSHSDLDRQIRAALHADAPPDQLARLEQFWRHQSRRHDRRRRVRHTVMASAALLAGLMLWQPWRQPSSIAPTEPTIADNQTNGLRPRPGASPRQHSVSNGRQQLASESQGRPATLYERTMFDAMVRQRKQQDSRTTLDEVETAIAQLMHDPQLDAKQLLASVNSGSVDLESLLLRQVDRHDDSRTRAVLQLLSVCGTSKSLRPLLKLSRRTVYRHQALDVIELRMGTDGLVSAVTMTDNRQVRETIYRRLLVDGESLSAYLRLVQDVQLRNEALLVAENLAPDIVNRLLDRLQSEDSQERLAAALVLGHANGPAVTESLIALVADNPTCPKEAWIALMACRGPEADQFLAYATGHPKLLGPLNRARVYLARLTN